MVRTGQTRLTTSFSDSGAKLTPPPVLGVFANGTPYAYEEHIARDPNNKYGFSCNGKSYTIPHINEGHENKITITLPNGRTESFNTQEDAEAEVERVKINLFYELTMSSVSASFYAEIAKTLFGNKVDNSGQIQLPTEVRSSIESAALSDSKLTGDDLNMVGEVLGKQNTTYLALMRRRKDLEANLKSSPALFLGQNKLRRAGIDINLFAVGRNLNDVSIGDLESLVSKLKKIDEEQKRKARE